ncbi:GNAT family N-acetyltransferase [Rhodococcus koreensis]|uniref:GNAT family N-acetyltransferase n=1 Tax=Rhodococcus koreensis TaxID=99653 RepID=UPI00366CC66D
MGTWPGFESVERHPVAEPQSKAEWPALVRIWRSAVEATHDFFTPKDVDFYESRMLSDHFPAVELTVAEVEETPVAFSGLAGNSLEMLFVDSTYRGYGVGSALLLRAIEYHPDLLLDVSEQNPQTVGFYQHYGFVVLSRSATDGDGRPFPMLHMVRSTVGAADTRERGFVRETGGVACAGKEFGRRSLFRHLKSSVVGCR